MKDGALMRKYYGEDGSVTHHQKPDNNPEKYSPRTVINTPRKNKQTPRNNKDDQQK